MSNKSALGMFEGVGIELEYMIVDRERLDALPVSDRVLAAQAGTIVSDIEFPDITWSNELVLHVIEFKTTGPVRYPSEQVHPFHRHVQRVNDLLEPLGGRLMPTGMHPWMDPLRETHLWPHDCSPIYEAFNRIFDCRGHGWANLQSLHVNLPFANDEEFGRLHAAIRLLLPILPALAASTPIVEGRATGILDNRLEAYRTNCIRIPSVAGRIVPEPVFSPHEYQERILQRIYRDLAPHDGTGILQYEWVNARGAIARFDRDTIEIRVIDMQECPAADLAIVAAVVAVLKLIVAETWADLPTQQAWPTEPLATLFEATLRDAEAVVIGNTDYLRALGWRKSAPCTAGGLWRHLIDVVTSRQGHILAFCEGELDVILRQGPLSRRIAKALGPAPDRPQLVAVYRRLCDGLALGEMFRE